MFLMTTEALDQVKELTETAEKRLAALVVPRV
jgi:hypothetical protein